MSVLRFSEQLIFIYEKSTALKILVPLHEMQSESVSVLNIYIGT